MTSRKRAAKACTACRQSKLKCDAVQRFPDKCSRCAKHGTLICELDLGSKYNFAKPAVHRVFKDSPGNNITLKHSPLGKSASPLTAHSSDSSSYNHYDSDKDSFRFPMTITLDDQRIGSVVVPGHVIVRMFESFYTNFYPLFPVFTYEFLDPVNLAQNPDMHILLWTICLVTSMDIAPELRPTLLSVINTQMATDAGSGPPSRELCQILSITLLCYWQQDDKTLTEGSFFRRSGQAVQTALQLGLHRAGMQLEDFRLERFRPEDLDQAVLCWSACFMCAQTLACLNGSPCSCPPLSKSVFKKLKAMAGNNLYLVPFIDQLTVVNSMRHAIDTMCNNLDSDDGLLDPSIRGAVHRSLLESFSILQTTFHSSKDPSNDVAFKITEMMALSYKVQVHSFLLFPDTIPADQDTVAIPLYLATVKSISLLTEIISKSRTQASIPYYVVRFTTAVTALLYGLTVAPCGEVLDIDGCKKGLADLYQLVSNLKSPIAQRSIWILNLLEDFLRNQDEIEQPLFFIRSRMGASAVYSILSRIKRLAEVQGRADPTKSPADKIFSGSLRPILSNVWSSMDSGNNTINGANIAAVNFADIRTWDDFWNWDVPLLQGT